MEIFTINVADPTIVTQITKGAQGVESRMPAWSPTGDRFVYAVRRIGVYQIWMMNADGTDAKQIVRSGPTFNDYQPAWSPKGDLVLFNQRCATSFCNPYVMSISATDRTIEQGLRVRVSFSYLDGIDYSLDGFYIAFEGSVDAGNLDIFYMTVAGGDRIRLTTDAAQDFHPAWRPATTTP